MATTTYTMTSTAARGIEANSAVSYAAAHDAISGTIPSTEKMKIGQKYLTGTYYVYRGFFSFDTSDLSETCLIKNAYLTFIVNYNNLSGKILLKDGRPTYPHNPPEGGDFDIDHYTGNGGEVDCTGKEANNTLILTLNNTGRLWISRTGDSKFALISYNDNILEPPTGAEEISLRSWSTPTPSYRMKLTVEYYEPTGIPAITSEGPCVDIQSTTMTAVGNVTDDGGGYEERGFEYYEDTTGYALEMYAVRELGVFTGTGNFEMTIYGLKPETTYQIRAWVRNSYGTAYGDWYTCTTTAVPTYSIYTESNDANYKLYLSDDEAIAWQGYRGPFNGKQKDINVTDLVNKTPGVKVLKLVSDARGTFHITITIKQNIKS